MVLELDFCVKEKKKLQRHMVFKCEIGFRHIYQKISSAYKSLEVNLDGCILQNISKYVIVFFSNCVFNVKIILKQWS